MHQIRVHLGRKAGLPSSFRGALNATLHCTCTVLTVSCSFLQISSAMKCHVPDMCLPWKESWATGFVSGSIKCNITLHLCCTNSLMEFLADFVYNDMPRFRYVSTMKGKLGYLNHFREHEMPHYTTLLLYQLSHGVSCRFPLQ